MEVKESRAGGPMHIRVSVFNGAWNLPIWVAQTQGFFEAADLDVHVLATKSSGALMQSLYAGDVEIALVGADNFLAYEEGLAEVEVEKNDELRLVLVGYCCASASPPSAIAATAARARISVRIWGSP